MAADRYGGKPVQTLSLVASALGMLLIPVAGYRLRDACCDAGRAVTLSLLNPAGSRRLWILGSLFRVLRHGSMSRPSAPRLQRDGRLDIFQWELYVDVGADVEGIYRRNAKSFFIFWANNDPYISAIWFRASERGWVSSIGE
eukprot:1069782-Amorphochlora_amoeboformis.AAC.3